jgi:hypothetical protein
MATLNGKTIQSRGQITIVDLNDGRSLNMALVTSSATQLYTQDAAVQFYPDFTTNNLIVEPIINISGLGNDIASDSRIAVSYKVQDSEMAEPSSLDDYFGDGNYEVKSRENKFKLVIKENLRHEYLKIFATAAFTEYGVTTNINASTQITKMDTGTSAINVYAETPNGDVFSSSNPEKVILVAHMYRGNAVDDSDIKITWEKMVYDDADSDGNPDWETITSTSANTNEYLVNGGYGLYPDAHTDTTSGYCTLIVKPDAVQNIQTYRCTIEDVDPQTNSGKVQAIFDVRDLTDPYQVQVKQGTPTSLTASAPSIDIYLDMYKGGELIENFFTKNDVSVKWVKYDKDGNIDTAWKPGGDSQETGGVYVKTGTNCNYVNISKSDVTYRTTMVFEVYL